MMRTKETSERLKALLRDSPLPLELLFAALTRFFLAAVLSQSMVLGEHSPFVLGFIAASGSGVGGAAAMLGGAVGCLLGMSAGNSIRYCAAAVLIYTVEFAFFDQKIYQTTWFMALCASVITGLTGFVYLSGGGWSPVAVVSFLSEIGLAGVSCLFFRLLPDVGEHPDRGSLLFLTAAVTVALCRVSPLLGGTVAGLCTLLATRAGAGASAVTGGAVGLAVGVATGGNPLLGGVLSFAGGLTGGPSARQGRLTAVLMFGTAGLLSAAWVHGGLSMAEEIAAAAVVYSILPERWLRRLDGWTCVPTAPAPIPTARRSPSVNQVRFRLEEQSTAFRTLYEHISESVSRGEAPENSSIIFDRVSERVCRECSHFQVCWRREHVATCQALTQALSVLLDRGHGDMKDFPVQFRNRCMRLSDFVAVANEELFCYWNRQQYRARLKNNRLAVCRQYAQLSDLLSSAAEALGEEPENDPSGAAAASRALSKAGIEAACELRVDVRGRRTLEVRGKSLSALCGDDGAGLLSQTLGVKMEPSDVFRTRQGQRLLFRQCPPLSATVATASRRKEDSQENGDNGLWFRDDNGILWVVLCDGMGSGDRAAAESRLLLTLLKDFLHAGVDAAASLATLTGALSLRGEVDGGFTTVDLLRLDLFNGSAALYKLGGAPTYLRRGTTVSRLTGSSLPAGLETDRESAPDILRLRVSDSDFLLMVTDGITDGSGDDWLRTLLTQYHGESPRELAQSILSSPNISREDDRTVIAVKVGKR